jgi:site-specific DNA recombinase
MVERRTPKVMDGYIRVSRRMGREGPGYISKTVQREAIQRWADYKGVTIARWHEDEDESGGTQNRPGMVEAMRRVEAGETDGIACWRLNRFARNVSEALQDVERVKAVGASLAFVEEDIDPTGPFGEFILTILLSVAALELNNISAGWETSKRLANDRGVYNARAPVGYLRVKEGDREGCLNQDPARGPLVTGAFDVADRDGLAAAISYLREHLPEMTWTDHTTRRLLGQRVYLGEVRYGDLVNPDAHEPLVRRIAFENVQRILAAPVKRRRAKEVFPLSHVARCASCGGALVGARGGNDARRMYRCADRKTCAAPVALSAQPLEDLVVAQLREAFDHPGFRIGQEGPDTAAAEEALREAENELDAFASDLTMRKALGHRYHHHLQQRIDAVDEMRAALHDALAEADASRVVVPAELWDELDPLELAEVLRAGLDSVIVRRGRGALAGRVEVVPKGMDRLAGAGA